MIPINSDKTRASRKLYEKYNFLFLFFLPVEFYIRTKYF